MSHDEMEQLVNEVAASIYRDAERYRWLRRQGFDRPAVMWVTDVRSKTPIVHTDLDEAIDAAIRKDTP